nr:hypothetical protein [Tanacetum cinerariifolium]
MNKFHDDETLSRYKAHLVANSSSQQHGVDFDETFSLVVKPAATRTRSLYGLKQAPRAWFQLFVASSTTLLQQIIASLHNEFSMTDLGALNYFLGILADRTSTSLFLSHMKYVLQLLERAHMVHCNPSQTPVDTESKLGPEGSHTLLLSNVSCDMFGGLWILVFSYMFPLLHLWLVILMLSGQDVQPHLGLFQVIVFFWKIIFLSWSSKRQHALSRSSAEAEYRGVANVVTETAWLRNLLHELHSPLSTATIVYCDNGRFAVSMYLLTKDLPSTLFEDFRSSLSVRPPPAQTAMTY